MNKRERVSATMNAAQLASAAAANFEAIHKAIAQLNDGYQGAWAAWAPPRAARWSLQVVAAQVDYHKLLHAQARELLATRYEQMTSGGLRDLALLGHEELISWPEEMQDVWEMLVCGLIHPWLYLDEDHLVKVTFYVLSAAE